MNSSLLKNIIALVPYFICVVVFANSNATIPIVQSDSLLVDQSNIESRSFSDLSDTYSGEEFVYERTVKTSGWWSRFKQWFKSLFNINSGKSSDKYVDMAMWIAASIIFLLVIFFLFKAIINKEGHWVFGRSSDKSIIPVSDIESNIQEADFNTLINQAETRGDYRLAIRFYYLWLLRSLSNAEIIAYDAEKTNADYLYEISQPKMKEEFSYMAYLYNYIWYGEFNVDQNQFNQAKAAFSQLLNTFKA